jgi:hypothetical protein
MSAAATVPRVSGLTCACAAAAVIAARACNIPTFSAESSRQMSAWLGLVPRQNSSGGESTLLGVGA